MKSESDCATCRHSMTVDRINKLVCAWAPYPRYPPWVKLFPIVEEMDIKYCRCYEQKDTNDA